MPWRTSSDRRLLKISASAYPVTLTKAGCHPPQKCLTKHHQLALLSLLNKCGEHAVFLYDLALRWSTNITPISFDAFVPSLLIYFSAIPSLVDSCEDLAFSVLHFDVQYLSYILRSSGKCLTFSKEFDLF
jgi:hypothetical protein